MIVDGCFFPLGWDEGCLTMRKGEVAKLTIAGHKGYGAQGFPAWGYPFLQILCSHFLDVCFLRQLQLIYMGQNGSFNVAGYL